MSYLCKRSTIDPHDFKQENLRVPIPILGADFRDFNEPAIEVWDNVTFADNYYQTVANPNGIGGTPNGRAIKNADLNVQLDGRTGFTWDNRIGGPHNKVFGWYAGTADFDQEEVQAGYEANSKGLISEPIYNRLGENSLSQLLDPKDPERYSKLTSWYESDSELNSEGIGEGWAYSVLGQGKRPKANLGDRTPVSSDNTDPDGTGGDFAVPTVFNGNFDYAIDNRPGKEIPDNTKVPGWSFHNGDGVQPLLYKYLVDKSKLGLSAPLYASTDNTNSLSAALGADEDKVQDFALQLGGGNPNSVTHNNITVPDWGTLRFDLRTGDVPATSTGRLKVTLEATDGSKVSTQIELQEAVGTAGEYLNDTRRIGYGETGFETFTLDVPDNLRGKLATVKFELAGGGTVYLDDVFFKSQHLLFGNPTEARKPDDANSYSDNYLLEKPQFSVSYSENDNIPNWSAWQLNSNWTGNADRPTDKFFGDPVITSLDWVGVKNSDYSRPKTNLPQINPDDGEPYKLAPGHLSPVSHRDRSGKDIWSTYLTTNVVPQFDKLNSPVWRDLENQFEKKLITRTTDQREIYIYSGSLGTKQDNTSINITSGSNAPYDIRVPEDLWRVVVVLEEPGLGIADINSSNTQAFALIAANELPTSTSPKPKFDPWYTNGNIVLTDIASLEDYLNLDPTNVARGIEYNFLSNLPDNVGTAIKNQTFPTLPPNSKPSDAVDAFLLADSVNSNSFIADTTIDPNSVPIDVFFEEKTFGISSNKTSISQIAFNNLGIKQTSTSQIGTGQISHYQRSSTQSRSTQVSPFEVGTIQTSGVKESSAEISPTQINPFNVGVGKIQPTEVDSTQITLNRVADIQSVASKVSDSSSIESENLFVLKQWFIDHAFAPNSSVVSNTLNGLWNYNLSTSLDIDFQITDLPSGQLAEATITGFDDSGKPNAGTILIDHDANGVGWFIDSTPLDNSEFSGSRGAGDAEGENYLLAAAESEASGKYDLLTTVLHELSHLYGFIDGYQGFNNNITTKNGTTKFIGDDFAATLDGEHLDKQAHPYDLLNTHLAPGMRKLPSELDVEILQAILKAEGSPKGLASASRQRAEGDLEAALTSDPLLAINNGDFSIADTTTNTFAWDTRGASGIENAQAVLTEDSPFLSNFTQTFTVPEAAKTIQFKLIETELGASELAPPDAFEVALLDADTKESLTSDLDLTETDSLLNIQPDGTAHFSDRVRIGGATSGEIINLDKSRTVTIDISDLTPGTEATLYFDLLGFGDVDSRVVIDDVKLSDQNLLPPVATDDRTTTSQGKPVTIDILANDSDDDGAIAPESVQIQTKPSHGTVQVNQDGTVTYTPGVAESYAERNRFTGTDTFTYLVADNDGQQTEEATVSVNVANAAPKITQIQIPDHIIEGDEVELEAIASDPGNDDLTYTWEFADGTEHLTVNSEHSTVSHVYSDNGTYTGSLTVTDTNGDSDRQEFEIVVENAAPIVDAGSDQTVNEGSAIALEGSFTDAGTEDTHTSTWNFGDGSEHLTLNSEHSTVSHVYRDNAEYTATYTVTDNDGAIASDEVTITVNNVNPVIESVTGDAEINEGDAVSLKAIASDPGDDTLTYAWDFGDGSETVMGQNVEHIFADNGLYEATVTVTDNDGASTTQNITITVNNLAPIIDPWLDKTATEGDTVQFTPHFSDPGILDTHTLTWDFGDGTTLRDAVTPTHVYTDNGEYDVTLTVTDNDGASTSSSLKVTVNNASPAISFAGARSAIASLTGDTEIDEGDSATFTAEATDPGDDELTYSWNFGDGSETVTGADPSHTFKDNGEYSVELTVTDDDGAAVTQTLEVVVNNIAPTINEFIGDTEINEGDTATFTALATDPGDDTLTYTWILEDGTTISGTDEITISKSFLSDGDYDLNLIVSDDEGATASRTLTIKVNNLPPIVQEQADRTANEGAPVAFNASFSDPGIDTHTIEWDFGDGHTVKDIKEPTHVYTDNGEYDVTLTVTDDEGASTSNSFKVTVNNVPPAIAELTGDTEINEGEVANFTALATDASGDSLTYSWNFGDGSNTATGQDITHTFRRNGNYDVELTVTDDDGAAVTQTLEVAVNNVAPTIIELTGDTEINEGDTATIGAVSTDPGAGELTYTWDFDDSNAQSSDTLQLTVKKLPTLAVNDLTIVEGDSGTANALFTVSLNEASTRPVTVNYTTANDTATAGNDYSATSGTLTFAPGQTSQTVTIPVTGDRLDEIDDNFTLNLIDPVNAAIADHSGLATIIDNDPVPSLTINDQTITEGDNGGSNLTFTVNLSEASGKIVTANYTTANGTATAGDDYTATSGVLTFAPGETTQTVTLAVAGDRTDEIDENFTLNLTSPVNASIADGVGLATIVDNDPVPSLTINDQTIAEGDSGTSNLTFTVSLSEASAKTVSVNYNTANGTAIAGSDYTAATGIVTFNPGQTSQTITVPITGDRLDEIDENFTLNLTSSVNASIADGTGLATIIDNDPVPSLTINDQTITEGDSGTNNLTFTVSLSEASAKTVTVNYNTRPLA